MSGISHYVASPVRPWLRLRNVRVCKSLHTGPRTYRAHDAPFVRARTRTREPTRVHFPRRAVWVEGTHGRRKQRIMVITVIKRRPLRTRPGSTWKIRYFTFECGGTIQQRRPTQTRESVRARPLSSPTLRWPNLVGD